MQRRLLRLAAYVALVLLLVSILYVAVRTNDQLIMIGVMVGFVMGVVTLLIFLLNHK